MDQSDKPLAGRLLTSSTSAIGGSLVVKLGFAAAFAVCRLQADSVYCRFDMVKLTSDLINNSVSRLNPLKDRELVLRGSYRRGIEQRSTKNDVDTST